MVVDLVGWWWSSSLSWGMLSDVQLNCQLVVVTLYVLLEDPVMDMCARHLRTGPRDWGQVYEGDRAHGLGAGI